MSTCFLGGKGGGRKVDVDKESGFGGKGGGTFFFWRAISFA
jgi:hypothetical protein